MTLRCERRHNILGYLRLMSALYMRIFQKVNIFGVLVYAFCTGSLYGQGMKFSDGQWIRMRVSNDGVYKITGADFKNAGINLNGKNPQHLSVFTHQGAMLPEMSRSAFHGTREIPVFVEDGNDGVLEVMIMSSFMQLLHTHGISHQGSGGIRCIFMMIIPICTRDLGILRVNVSQIALIRALRL